MKIKITIILTFAGVLFLTSCQTNAQNKTQIPAHYAPLNPTRPDILDLEVPEGTLSIKSRTFIHNRTEKKSVPKELVITNLNNAGMITYISKKNLVESGVYEIEKRTYDAQNRVTKKEHLFITNKDTLAQISKITYTGANPLIAKWETDMEVFYEKMYFDQQGIVVKSETMETLEDKKSIYTVETYNPLNQKGVFTGIYPEGGNETFNLEYQNGNIVSEVASDPNSDFKLQRIYRDSMGYIVRINKQYSNHINAVPYLEKKLYYSNNIWLGAVNTIDYDANLKPNEVLFTFREITTNSGIVKPTKEISDQVFKELEFPKSKTPF